MASPTISIAILADAAKARKALDDTGSDLEKLSGRADRAGAGFGASLANIGKNVLAVGGLAAAGFGAVAAGAWAAAEESAKIGRETERVIQSTGATAWTTADQVGDLATSLSEVQGVDDEVVQSVGNLLLTFTNVKNAAGEGNDVFNQATALASDMAAVLGTDASQAAVQLGKALNDPTKGITALSRSGVSFTEQQKEQIKTLQASGDMLGAQKIVLGELSKEFGGAAEAAATPLDRLKIMIGNAQEAFGEWLIPIVAAAAEWLGEKLPVAMAVIQPIFEEIAGGIRAFAAAFSAADGDVTSSGFPGFMERIAKVLTGSVIPAIQGLVRWGQDHILPVLQTLGSFLVDSVIPGIVTLGQAIWDAGKFVADNIEYFSGLGIALGLLGVVILASMVPSMIAWAVSTWAAVAAQIALWAPIAAIIAVIALLVAGIIYAYQNWDFFRTAVDKVKDVLLFVWNNVLSPLVSFIVGTLIPAIIGFASKAIEVFVSIGSKVGEVIGFVFAKFGDLVSFISGLPGRIADAARGMWDGIQNSFKSVLNFLIDAWNRLDFGIDVNIPDWVPVIGGRGFNVPDIIPDLPRLATGGIVTSPTVALIGEAGAEAIVPLDRYRSGNTTITINVTHTGLGADSPQVGRDVVAAIRAYERRNGPISA